MDTVNRFLYMLYDPEIFILNYLFYCVVFFFLEQLMSSLRSNDQLK